jgi:hypothetical protein
VSPDDAFDEYMSVDLKNFMVAVRTQLPERPDPRLEADLVGRLATEARTADGAAAAAPTQALPPTPVRRRFALPARVVFAALLGVLSMAGLAVAGVKLPAAVDSAFEKAGVNLPNQPADDAAPTEQGAPAGGTEGAPSGSKQKGSANGHGKQQGRGKKAHGHGHGKAVGDQQGGSRGNSQSASGHTKPHSK